MYSVYVGLGTPRPLSQQPLQKLSRYMPLSVSKKIDCFVDCLPAVVVLQQHMDKPSKLRNINHNVPICVVLYQITRVLYLQRLHSLGGWVDGRAEWRCCWMVHRDCWRHLCTYDCKSAETLCWHDSHSDLRRSSWLVRTDYRPDFGNKTRVNNTLLLNLSQKHLNTNYLF